MLAKLLSKYFLFLCNLISMFFKKKPSLWLSKNSTWIPHRLFHIHWQGQEELHRGNAPLLGPAKCNSCFLLCLYLPWRPEPDPFLHLFLLPLPILACRAQAPLPSTAECLGETSLGAGSRLSFRCWAKGCTGQQLGISQINALWLPSASVSLDKNALSHGKAKAEG